MAAVAEQRQQRQRAGVHERLAGAAAVGLVGFDGGHQGAVAAVAGRGGDAGGVAHPRAGAVGAHQQIGGEGLVAGGDPPAVAVPGQVVHRGVAVPGQGVALTGGLEQRGGEVIVLQQPAQAVGAGVGGAETHLAGAVLVPHLHAGVSLHPLRIQTVPDAGVAQQPVAGLAERGHPWRGLAAGAHRRRAGVQHPHREALVRQQQRQQAAGHAAADDQNIGVGCTGKVRGVVGHGCSLTGLEAIQDSGCRIQARGRACCDGNAATPRRRR